MVARNAHNVEVASSILASAPIYLNTKSVGELSEGIILAHLLKKGYSVALPFGNNQRYDLVVDDGDRLWKAQCKTGKLKNGCVVFWACSTNGFNGKKSGYKGQVELFFVYSPELDRIYRVPVADVGETQVALRIDAPRNTQKCFIRWAKDYECVGPK